MVSFAYQALLTLLILNNSITQVKAYGSSKLMARHFGEKGSSAGHKSLMGVHNRQISASKPGLFGKLRAPWGKLFSTKERVEEETREEEEKEEAKASGHGVRNDGVPEEIDPEELAIQQRFMEHQKNAPKLDAAVEVRTLIEYNHGFAVLSTLSKSHEGYPEGSVVGFFPDSQGRPVFSFSGMSSHTQNVLLDSRCSLTVADKNFKGAADGRVTLLGNCSVVRDAEEFNSLKEEYMKKHPGAFWINFSDFNWFRMEIDQVAKYVGGFARAGQLTSEQYRDAKPDPISQFGGAIASHMNDDHQDATKAIISNQIPGLDVTEAIITSVDSLGMYVKVKRVPRASDQPQQFKLRIPFPRPAEDRKDVKNLIVEMTQAAAGYKKKE